MMKRLIAVLLCIVLVLCLSACSFLRPKLMSNAQTAWEAVDSGNVDSECVYVMQYTSRSQLTSENQDAPLYSEIPSRGYVVLFHTYTFPAFHESYACFLDEDGEVELTFDYEESYELHEYYYSQFSLFNIQAGEIALEYISNCNFISSMINSAHDVCEELKFPGRHKKNVWYLLSENQIEWVQD